MQFDLVNVLVFAILGAGFLAATLLIGSVLRPNTPDPEKLGIYECGEKPMQQAWFNFNPRFYIIALIFLIFDVEVAFTYPVATVFRRWVAEGAGGFAFLELFVFIAILVLGLAYVWRKGDLEWIRKLREEKPVAGLELPTQPGSPDEKQKAA